MLAIIGGSGLYEIAGLSNAHWIRVDSPFGVPSDEIFLGELNGTRIAFLPRHARGHRIPPTAINYRANIDVLKRIGATEIISVSAVGSLREHLSPGMFVIVDPFVDRTFAREKTFFDTGLVGHVAMARPVCARLGDVIEEAAREIRAHHARGGTYLVMEGPQFSTFAESEIYRLWNCDVIGMTNMPEAKLAREAELCYATIAMVTDYDCWHPNREDVTVEMVIATLAANVSNARALITHVVPKLAGFVGPCPHGCQSALQHSIATSSDARDFGLATRLDAVAGRFFSR